MGRILSIAGITWLEMLRRKDLYVLFVLLVALLAVLVSLNVFGLGGVTGYVKDAGLLAAWVFGWVLAVIVGVRQLPQEESRGTVFSLLAKPITRRQLVVGRWLGAWSIVAMAVLCFYATLTVVVYWKGGRFDWVALGQAWMLHAALVGVLAALAIALSTRMSLEAAATLAFAVSGGAMVVLPAAADQLGRQQGIGGILGSVLYYAMPHLELFDMRRRLVHDFGPAPWPIFASVLGYGAVLVALFLVLAWIGYRRKTFSRAKAGW